MIVCDPFFEAQLSIMADGLNVLGCVLQGCTLKECIQVTWDWLKEYILTGHPQTSWIQNLRGVTQHSVFL